MKCEADLAGCSTYLDADGDGRLCLNCYARLMPYSSSNRLLRHEYDDAIANFRNGVKPPKVSDPILDFLRKAGFEK